MTRLKQYVSIGSALAVIALASGCECSTPNDEACRGSRCDPGGDAGGQSEGGNGRDAEVGPREDAGPCRAISAESTVESVPVDIIVVIDNSLSMSEEAAEVRDNINRFAEIIAMSGLDYHVVLISRPDGSRGVCVPAPLGSGPDACESGPEGRLLAVHRTVGSHDALEIALDEYPNYRSFLRQNAAKVFLWISDDEADDDITADSFRAALAALEPAGMFDRTVHNAIVGFFGDVEWENEDAGECDSLANVGNTYLRLANCYDDDDAPIAGCTSGSQARVCETDWTGIFEAIAQGVVAGAPVVCEFAVPEPPSGFDIDFAAVGVTYRSGDAVPRELTRVANAAACTANGWFYDDPAAPSTIALCPDVCRTVQADPNARLDVALGCDPRLE